MDKIKITDLEIFSRHGVFPEEQKLGQKFLVSAVLYTDTRKAGKTDDLTASIHYGDVCHIINDFLTKHTFQLLERAAEALAEELLLHINNLRKVILEIKKPWAPIGLPLETVSVEITRGWHTAYIALGSNLGDKKAYLDNAIQALDTTAGCRVTDVSSYLETAPYGMTEQDNFLNACLRLETLLTPTELLEELHRIEASAGRERLIHWGPRTLDLDIIFYDDLIYADKMLCIPHAEMHKRQFVLEPLQELAPYHHHPATGKTVHEMLEALTLTQTI